MRVKKIKQTVLGLALAGTLVGVAACGGGSDDAASDKPSDKESSSASGPAGGEADLSGVPDVVAEVNDEEISKDDFAETYESQFQQASMQAQSTGQPVDQEQLKKQVAETMVGTELLSQEAEKQGFEVSGGDVDTALTDLAKQNGMPSAAKFLAALKEQGMSEDDVRSDVAQQESIEQLLTEEGGVAKPTEAELRKIYDQAKQQQAASGQGGKMPSFKQVRSQLVEQAESEKQNTVAQKLVKSLREQGDVTINV